MEKISINSIAGKRFIPTFLVLVPVIFHCFNYDLYEILTLSQVALVLQVAFLAMHSHLVNLTYSFIRQNKIPSVLLVFVLPSLPIFSYVLHSNASFGSAIWTSLTLISVFLSLLFGYAYGHILSFGSFYRQLTVIYGVLLISILAFLYAADLTTPVRSSQVLQRFLPLGVNGFLFSMFFLFSVALANAEISKSRLEKGLSLHLAILIVPLVFMTGSRQILIAVMLVFLAHVLIYRRYRYLLYGVIFISIWLILDAQAFEGVLDRLDQTMRRIESNYFDPRVSNIIFLYPYFELAPLFGSGPGFAISRLGNVVEVHIAELVVDYGAIFLALFVLSLLLMLKRIRANGFMRDQGRLKPFHSLLTALAVGLFLVPIFNEVLFSFFLYILLGSLLRLTHLGRDRVASNH